jgi:tRNA (Thr-GGU) A37 N-methylase
VIKRENPSEDVKDKNLVAKAVLRKNLTKALDGIEEYSHTFVLFWLHETAKFGKPLSEVHPGEKEELPLTGVFATRTPDVCARFNP